MKELIKVLTSRQKIKLQKILTEAHNNFEVGLKKRAYFKLSDRRLGEDMVQETFVKTWKYLIKGGEIQLMKAFLYHILNNLIIDEYRKKKPVSLDFLIEKGFEPSVDDVPRIIDKLDGKSVLLLIKQLPIRYQTIMLMRYVQDLTLQEMSDVNGQSKGTNSTQISRGTQMVRVLNKKRLKEIDKKTKENRLRLMKIYNVK